MAGRCCVVTGASEGIGREVAVGLARRGDRVVFVGRSLDRLTSAYHEAYGPAEPSEGGVHVADLSILAQVDRLARTLGEIHPRIDVLVNNAGAIFDRRVETSEGHERTWALNVLAPFLLSWRLAPNLASGSPGRIVNLASAAHRGQRLHLDDPEGRASFRGYRAYGRSKLALLLLTYEFARRFDARQVTVNAAHPGFVATRFGRDSRGLQGLALRVGLRLFGIPASQGAETPLFLASDPSVAAVTGGYFARRRRTLPSRAARDPTTASALWALCRSQTHLEGEALPASAEERGVIQRPV